VKINKKQALNQTMLYALVESGYIPFDKSWMIRLGVLDLLNGHKNMINFLGNQKEICEDLEALLRSSIAWNENKPIDVGESGTLYRCLRYAAWKRGENREFIKRGTLKKRKIFDDPDIVNWPLEGLLCLDEGTTQWVTAALLCGSHEIMHDAPPKIELTYSAIEHWNEMRAQKKCWHEAYDLILVGQAVAYLKMLAGNPVDFVPVDAEDYCFARAFNYISPENGIIRWPQLPNHESNRIIAMEEAMKAALSGQTIVSDDHRVVQAMAMWGKVNNVEVHFSNPNAVKKSWPQFWRFLEYSSKAA
jgi:hypothetical protein